MSQKYDVTLKIGVITDSLEYAMNYLNRYAHDKFETSYVMSIGMEPMYRYETYNGVKVVYSLWLMAPGDRFRVMQQMFYRDTNYFLVRQTTWISLSYKRFLHHLP